MVAAAREGLRKPELEEKLPRVAELPFDSDHKRMTTVHEFSEPGSSGIPEALKTVLGRSLEKTTAPW